MLDHLRKLADVEFSAHGNCYQWTRELIWLMVSSDMLIGTSYVLISLTLVYLVRRIRNLPFHWMFLAFGLFIIACGATHFMQVWVIWQPRYWLEGWVKLLTALASVTTALALPPLVPKVVGLFHAAELSEERRHKLEATNRELEMLYKKVRDLDELKTQFFANVSHELRTPLALVLGPAEKLLAQGGLGDGQRHDLEVIARNARGLLKHVNDLLDVAKLEAGKMGASYADTDLARLVRLTAADFEGLAAARRLTFAVEAPPALPAQADPEMVQRVLLNLLSNAFKFAPEGGHVRCRLEAADGRAALTVEDDGPGVRPELREAVFERFRQAEGGVNRRFGGTGLGLAIVKDFTTLHGGTVTLGEAPGGGASFRVELPLTAPAGTAVRPAPAAAAAVAGTEAARLALEQLRTHTAAVAPAGPADRPLVLVVEDNVEMRRFVAETLAGDYRVDTAADGKEGLDKALAVRPDLILSDVMMPVHGGDELVRQARARPELDAVPIILLTAKADDDLRVRLLREGAQDYLLKPFVAEELRARVANLVTMKRAREVLQTELASQVRDLEALAKEVSHRKRELGTALEAMRVARDQAEQASQVKSDFLSLVSHELRTPLTGILLYLQSLQRSAQEGLTPRQREVVGRIETSSRRLSGLIESLLEYARLKSGRLVGRVEPVDLPALAADVLEELRPQADMKQLELRLAPPGPLEPLRSDPRLVRLVLLNLVDNAVKYTERGAVEVALSQADGTHRLAVRDTGPGIPPDRRGVIFEPFEQLEPLRRKHTPGVGLGLALVREMVEALGGRVELESQVGAGSTFTVLLPPAGEREA